MKFQRKDLIVAAAAILVALGVAALTSQAPVANLRFHLGLYDREGMKRNIEATLKQFNRDYATLYNTSGPTSILGSFPADNLLKRRIFQEIRYWDQLNSVMVYDKDTIKIERIDCVAPDRAIVVTHEIWYISAQNAETRKRISTLKRGSERVRYFMQFLQGKWRVMEYEIYDENDVLPEVVRS
jgi:hypothetical protein